MTEPRESVRSPALRARLSDIQRRLGDRLREIDPHQHLAGRPVSYHIISGRTIEVVYHGVPSLDESDVRGIKRSLGQECFCRVTPETTDTLRVHFVIPLEPPGAAW